MFGTGSSHLIWNRVDGSVVGEHGEGMKLLFLDDATLFLMIPGAIH
jgi:hypothetical protein